MYCPINNRVNMVSQLVIIKLGKYTYLNNYF